MLLPKTVDLCLFSLNTGRMKPRNKNGNNTKCFSRILLSGFSLGLSLHSDKLRNFCSRTLGCCPPHGGPDLPDHGQSCPPHGSTHLTCSSERPQHQQCRNRTCPHPHPTHPTKRNADLCPRPLRHQGAGLWECVCSCQGGSEQPDHSQQRSRHSPSHRPQPLRA